MRPRCPKDRSSIIKDCREKLHPKQSTSFSPIPSAALKINLESPIVSTPLPQSFSIRVKRANMSALSKKSWKGKKPMKIKAFCSQSRCLCSTFGKVFSMRILIWSRRRKINLPFFREDLEWGQSTAKIAKKY